MTSQSDLPPELTDPHLKLKALFLRHYFIAKGVIEEALMQAQVSPLEFLEWKEQDPWFRKMFDLHRELIADSQAMLVLRNASHDAKGASSALKALSQISTRYDLDFRKVQAVQQAVAMQRGYLKDVNDPLPWQQAQLPAEPYDPVMSEKTKAADSIIDAEFSHTSPPDTTPKDELI